MTVNVRLPEPVERLAERVRACRLCADLAAGALPHAPRPVLRVSSTATMCIASQAPGTKVHATGIPFNDASGDRLRDWLGIGREVFYDERRIAIVPMGFCFPGQDAKGGDLPPRRECAAHWHAGLFAAMPKVRLVLAIGLYAQAWHLGPSLRDGLTTTVAAWRAVMAETTARGRTVIPLPHPSWRNNGWLRKNPWFEAELLPVIRERVRAETAG